MHKFWKYYLPPILCAAAIFWNSSRPHLSLPQLGFQNIDKIGHFAVYFILGYLVIRAFAGGAQGKIYWKKSLLLIMLGILYGASDELHQMIVPGRSADILDWIADCFGIIFGHVTFLWVRTRAKNRQVRIDLAVAAKMEEKSTQ